MTRTFVDSLARGHIHEAVLDSYLSHTYELRAATDSEQRHGIDRWVTNSHGQTWSIDYKADERADSTGRVFIELSHCGPRYGANGWLFSSAADAIVYWLPVSGRGWWVWLPNLRRATADWLKEGVPIRPAMNVDYWTLGLVVPIPAFAALAAFAFQRSTADDVR